MAIKRGLGRGLNTLIPVEASKEETKEKQKEQVKVKEVIKEVIKEKDNTILNIDEIEPNREQPRKKFEEDALLELADSIKQFGILQPLLVKKRKDYYEIIAGERRWRAAKLAGLKEVPVIVKDLSEQEIVEISLIENIQRENLNPIEEAIAFKRLLTEMRINRRNIKWL